MPNQLRLLHRVVGPVQTNCYIVIDERNRAAVVDPGGDGPQLTRIIRENGAEPELVLLTHGHFDHTGGLSAFAGVPVYIHTLDQPMLSDGRKNCSGVFGAHAPAAPQNLHNFQDGDEIPFGCRRFRVMHTPGHTPGSSMFFLENLIFSGDTLFREEVGRCDLWGGSLDQMRASTAKIAQIPGEYRVLPGHDAETTLSWEKAHNPYLGSW